MIDKLTMHVNGRTSKWGVYSLEDMFKHNVRFQVLCQNQEELDYLQAMCLVYGRSLQVDVWDEWLAQRKADRLCTEPLLPIVYTTFHVNLRDH